ncbi:uncharacterized protein CDAR_164331 [Caerostris darwini]|uniref:Uncharacterized protein n=1 Tax=Caerostris darwini TaxID=1538125 RepID=A0AAV4VNZ8_9ARAC|nr:uncharacterized protein CDAR_164331 [Caerostris darwini]
MRKKISPNSLYKLCIEETAFHLLEKFWKRKNTNPFSQVNCNIVNDLFQFLVLNMDIEKPSPLKLLLKSGQLQDLVLDGVDFTEEQWESLMTILLEEADSCRNITYILLPESFQNDENSLERLVEKCPLLERLDVSTFFNLSALKNSKMLQNHPKLVSLGITDSSWAAHHIYTTCKMDTVPRFGLKECFWGFNRNVDIFNGNQIAYTQQYPEFVKSSVVLFPLVEKLCIVVYHEDCIQHLKKLKHLRVLEIDFSSCCCSPARTAFISLLSEIGPQLKRLSIVGRSTMPVDVVMKYCSNVVRLDLRCSAIVQGGIETDSNNFRHLKKLIVIGMDEESLEYLLRNSLNLKELLLVEALCWDDTLLHKIFKKNSLSQVNTIAVHECRLSREGLKELVQKCVNLEKIAFETLDADLTSVAKELNRDIRATYSYVERNLIGI